MGSLSQKTFQQLVKHSLDTIVLLDANGIQRFVSDSCEKVHGYRPDELINLPVIAEMIHPDDQERTLAAFQEILSKGSGGTQYRHRHKQGGWVYLEGFGTNQLDNPEIQSIVVNVRDITERKKWEQVWLRNQKLESLGTLAGGIAHDFNNLFSGIFGYVETAKIIAKDPDVSLALTKALKVMDRARSLTQQLLTFAKGGSPTLALESIAPLLKEASQFCLSGSAVTCVFEFPTDLWPCEIDRNQISQVIENLLLNAQQAMSGSGAITLAAQNCHLHGHDSLPAGAYLQVTIQDQGIGIPKEFLSRIFDPYFTTKPQGHGLGLATCHSIIRQHHGAIEVESEPGKGSTFHIYLPACPHSLARAHNAAPTIHHGSGTFLVMDDEEFVRETTSSMLQTMGYTPLCFADGQAAVDYFAAAQQASQPIRGLIFDLTVPGGLGGKDAIQSLRRLDSQVPVFVASGYADDPIMADPGQFGFTASLCKPYLIDDLAELLNQYL